MRSAACSCRWRFCLAKRSSLTGRKTGRSSAASRTKLQVAHFKLSHSRAFILRAYLLQTHEMLRSTPITTPSAVLGGVPQRGIYDNMRTANVDKPIGRRQGAPGQRRPLLGDGQPFPIRGRVLQSSLRVGEGTDREERPGRSPSALGSPCPTSPPLAALNDWLETRCQELWAQTLAQARSPAAIVDVWAEESRTSDAAFQDVRRLRRIRQARVADVPGPTWTAIAIACPRPSPIVQSAYESIPNASLSPPRDKSSANIAAFLMPSSAPTARVRPPSSIGGTIWRSFRRKPGAALRNGAPFAELPPAFRALQQRMLKTPGGDREMVEIPGSRPPA